MNAEQEKIVNRLQNNLFTLRQLAGWNADELGARLDLTKQTIYNLERGKPKMSWVQYLAIRKIFELEIEKQPDNKVLQKAIVVLLDGQDLPDQELEELQEALKTIAKGMTRSANRTIALKLALQTIGAATAGIAAGMLAKSPGAGISAWLSISKAMINKK